MQIEITEKSSLFHARLNTIRRSLDPFVVPTSKSRDAVELSVVQDLTTGAEVYTLSWITLEKALRCVVHTTPVNRWHHFLHAVLPASLRQLWVRYEEMPVEVTEIMLDPPPTQGASFCYRYAEARLAAPRGYQRAGRRVHPRRNSRS